MRPRYMCGDRAPECSPTGRTSVFRLGPGTPAITGWMWCLDRTLQGPRRRPRATPSRATWAEHPQTLTLSGAASGTAKTDGSGNFNFPGLANGGYLIVPSQSGFAFTPATAAVTVNHANVSGLAFTAVQNETHSVTLSWTPSVSPNITGYKIYRSGVSGGPYGFLNGPVSGPNYVDKNVAAGQKYFYVTTAVKQQWRREWIFGTGCSCGANALGRSDWLKKRIFCND